MRICFMVPGSFPSPGGFETLVQSLVQSLSKDHPGLAVDIVCAGTDPHGRIGANVRVFPILRREFTALRRGGFALSVLWNAVAFFRYLRRTAPTIVHAHPVHPVSLVAKLFGIPVVGTSHGVDIQKDEAIGYGVRLGRLAATTTAFTLRSLTLHTLVSESMLEEAIEAGGRRANTRVVYNGVNLAAIPSAGGSDILERLRITEEDFVVLFLGRLIPKKSPQDLVEALPLVLQDTPHAKCVFAGRGSEERSLKSLVSERGLQERVLFGGFVTDQEKWDLLKRCDVFVLPSRKEGLPLTVIEAMACGKPVVTTNVGPFPELVREGENGFMVPLHAPSQLAEAIGRLARDENRRRQMGERAREDAERRFDIHKIAVAYLELYRELVDSR